MALTTRGDGTGAPFLVGRAWWNDYKDLLTGVMNDQAVALNFRPGSGSTPTLILKGDGFGVLLKGYKTDNTTNAFNIDSNGNQVNAGGLTIAGSISGVTTLGMSGALSGATTGGFSGAVSAGSLVLSGGISGATSVAMGGALTGATTGAFSSNVTITGTLQVTGNLQDASGTHNYPIMVATTGTVGRQIYVGTSTPSSPNEGDIWVKA
jgi:hypothetical protein